MAEDEVRGIESPCVKTCAIDPQARLCIGCLRTLDEIAGWTRMTSDERRAVMAALPSRAPLLEPASPAPAGRLADRG